MKRQIQMEEANLTVAGDWEPLGLKHEDKYVSVAERWP